MKKRCLILIAAILGISAVKADSIIDTGTPDGTGSANLIGQYGGYIYERSEAGQFTLSQGYTITAVSGFMANYAGYGGTVDAVIYGSTLQDGSVPVPDINNKFWSGTFSADSPTTSSWLGISGLDWNLGAGTYWLAFEPQGSTFYGWMPTVAPNPLANYTTGINSGTSNYSTAGVPGVGIRIDGVASVPEPSTYALFGIGTLLIVIAYRRRLTCFK